MKHVLFTCIFTVLVNAGFGQLPQQYAVIYNNRHTNWEWWRNERITAVLCEDFLRFLYTDTSSVTGYFCGRSGDPYSEDQSFEAFEAYHDRFVHVLRYGDYVVYDGRSCGGYESGHVYVFHREADGAFREVLATPGTATYAYIFESGRLLLKTWRYPCCADTREVFSSFEISPQDGTITWKQLDAIAVAPFADERHVLNYLHTQPRTITKTTYLLDGPDSANLSIHPAPSEIDGDYTPVIAVYPAGATINVQGEFQDEAGKEWYFVTVDVSEPAEHFVYNHDIAEKTVTRYAGWMIAAAFAK